MEVLQLLLSIDNEKATMFSKVVAREIFWKKNRANDFKFLLKWQRKREYPQKGYESRAELLRVWRNQKIDVNVPS